MYYIMSKNNDKRDAGVMETMNRLGVARSRPNAAKKR